jgi:hypothetical protein
VTTPQRYTFSCGALAIWGKLFHRIADFSLTNRNEYVMHIKDYINRHV